jgi:type I restriction enzyme S subunit
VCCEKEDILMTRTGNTGIVVTGVEGVFHNNFFKINFDKNKINRSYLLYYLRDKNTQKIILDRAGTSTIPDLNHKDFYSIPIPIPPTKAEQAAIATALSDVDALISALDNLIAKKRLIKQGAMQELLSGKKRLAGFCSNSKYKQTEVGVIPEDWEECYLSDAVDFLDGQRRPIKSSEREKVKGIYPYYGASGIIDYVSDYIFDDELILLGEDGENILSRNLPLAFQVRGKIWVNNHAHVLKPKENFDIIFLTNFLESLDYSLLNSGTAQPKLNKQSCLKIKIVKPTKAEQTAIAQILSDMDTNILALETQRNKTLAIKQGMMQELLTGKTRLI